MKTILILISAITIFSSCTKCITCTYLDEKGITQITNETCGSTDDMQDFENGIRTIWGEFGTVTCTK